MFRKRTILITVALLSVGCGAAALPTRYPSRPPASMPAAQADGDVRHCVDLAARAQTERAWSYIGCLVSKGHGVGVAFQVRGTPTHLYVTQTRSHAGRTAASELEQCRKAAYAAGRADAKAEMDAIVVESMERAFRACLEPLGYVVQRRVPVATDPR